MRTVKVSSAKPSNMAMMREKNKKPKYSPPDEMELGCRLVRRKTVAATTAYKSTFVLIELSIAGQQ